jgi:hypothetical protein
LSRNLAKQPAVGFGGFSDMAYSFVFVPFASFGSLAGLEHGRTTPF